MKAPDHDLIVPVYLNQTLVFDLVAMLQGGISQVRRVSEAKQQTKDDSAEAGGVFGLSQALSSLLRIDLSGKVAETRGSKSEWSADEERVHTPASLFFTLRGLLISKEVLHPMDGLSNPEPGQFIEFKAALRRNPLIEGLDALIEILELVNAFTPERRSKKPKGSSRMQSGTTSAQGVQKQLRSISTSLRAGGTQDLIADQLHSDYRALLTVEEKYLNDPLLSDLVDGTFRILGKVTRTVKDESASISLLRKTALSRVPPSALEAITKALDSLQTDKGFSLPEMEIEIPGPVIQVLPIAVFS